jgi:hypothetical protein
MLKGIYTKENGFIFLNVLSLTSVSKFCTDIIKSKFEAYTWIFAGTVPFIQTIFLYF